MQKCVIMSHKGKNKEKLRRRKQEYKKKKPTTIGLLEKLCEYTVILSCSTRNKEGILLQVDFQ